MQLKGSCDAALFLINAITQKMSNKLLCSSLPHAAFSLSLVSCIINNEHEDSAIANKILTEKKNSELYMALAFQIRTSTIL